ncbi:MAG: 3-hydroxyacyl-CoA dehydrogenase NAD-binding domain-containing protein [Ignavibacteria bacterium]|jgi:3-hydroxybutyryl-CoA dehydrogenase
MIVGICGAGTMGRGIAIASILSGHRVVLFDINQGAVDSAVTYVHSQLQKSVEKGKLTEQAYKAAEIHGGTELALLAPADLVVEAVAELIEIKHALFTKIEEIVRPSCILTTNTSSISIASIARALKAPERFAGLHFFNPAHIMKLVEVIKGPRTSEATIAVCVEFANGLSKSPVVAKDAPGFIVNRIARNYYNESQRIVMEGAGSIENVDTLMKGLGFKMGPFELMDLIGVDVNLDVTKSQWNQFFQEPRFTPSLMQQQAVDAGLHGKKSGRGFYDYSVGDK